MNQIARFENIEGMIRVIRERRVILDADIAVIYGVETKRVNEAVKNNPEKFPADYVLELTHEELSDLRSKISTANLAKTRTPPKAFTEKGLYMLATKELSALEDKSRQKNLMQRSGELIAEILDDDLQTRDAETTIELNFAVLKFKHTVKKSRSGKAE